MSLKRFCKDGELFKPTELPSWGDNDFLCASIYFLTPSNHHKGACSSSLWCVRACLFNLKGFLQASHRKHLLLAWPPQSSTLGHRCHKHPHAKTRASALHIFSSIRLLCMGFKAVSVNSVSIATV